LLLFIVFLLQIININLEIVVQKLFKFPFTIIPQKDKESFLSHINYIPKKGLTKTAVKL